MNEHAKETETERPAEPQDQLRDVVAHGLERFHEALEVLESRLAIVLRPQEEARLELMSAYSSPFGETAARLHILVDRLESLTRRIEL